MTDYQFQVNAGAKITVRKAAQVAALDQVGTLSSLQKFSGIIVKNTADEMWVQLTSVFPGRYVAVKYRGTKPHPEWFATSLSGDLPLPAGEEQPEPPAPIGSTVIFGFMIDPDAKQINLQSPTGIDLKDWEIFVDGKPYGME